LKAAVVEYTATHYGRRVDDANVLISAAAKPALWNLLFAMVDPGDEVIVLAPYWVSYPEMVRMVCGEPVIAHARDGSLRPSLADLEAARSPRTRAILLNSPNNPSGLAYDDSFVASAVEFAERHGIWLVCDDIYHQLVFDGRSQVPAWQHTTRDVDVSRVVVVKGVSKVYGMTGLRVGWAIGPRELVRAMTTIQGQVLSCLSPVTQAAAEGR
jgi:aspartate aminotransferase